MSRKKQLRAVGRSCCVGGQLTVEEQRRCKCEAQSEESLPSYPLPRATAAVGIVATNPLKEKKEEEFEIRWVHTHLANARLQ